MLRWTGLLLVVAACARSGPPPARLFPAGGGECTDPAGCAVPIADAPEYRPSDADHLPPDPEGNLGPNDKKRDATCAAVGESVASLEVGNYAEPEERAPAERKYRALCAKAKLTATERQCVFEAQDTKTIAWCSARFWPQQLVAMQTVSECANIASDIRQRMPVQGVANDTWPKHLAAIQKSCEEDRWTAELGVCARALQYPTYIVPYCAHLAPEPLRAKLMDRIAAVQ
jgi:hypothetical protein